MSSPPGPSIRPTLGALEAGAFVGIFLSGILSMQCYLYYVVYPKDKVHIRCLVAILWTLDLVHTVFICVANWIYLVENFGDVAKADHIFWTIPATVALTALVTFLVHMFFTHRIYVVSKGKKYIAIPLVVLATFRLSAALVSTGEMIRLGSFREYVDKFEWVFTMGLSSAVAFDVLITVGLIHYLRKSKTGFKSMNEIIDTLVLYTVETGVITATATIASLICWTVMPHFLIFLGLHFTISKLYANTFLATLNSRATLRARQLSSSHSGDRDPPSLSNIYTERRNPSSQGTRSRRDADPLSSDCVQITIEKTITREVEGQFVDVPLQSLDRVV